jgi:hydroxypyruvate reductase
MIRRVPVRRPDDSPIAATESRRALLLDLYRSALQAVDGRRRVALALSGMAVERTAVISVGKAAGAMMTGAQEILGQKLIAGFVVTAAGYECGLSTDARIEVHVGDHPVPGERSLEAGAALARFLRRLPLGLPVLVLVSGGASSLLEEPLPGVTLGHLQALNQWAHREDIPIGVLNALRRRLSGLKDGRLAARLQNHPAQAFVLSDVPGDDPRVVGSGIVARSDNTTLSLPRSLPADLVSVFRTVCMPTGTTLPVIGVGSLSEALDAVEARAVALGLTVQRVPARIDGPAAAAGRAFAAAVLAMSADVLIGGGETTVQLPDRPGVGGRCQHLALAAALGLRGHANVWLLAAGTDGIDGASVDAGAIVDGRTIERAALGLQSADDCLLRADSGRCLEASGDLLHTGPTTTNVGDIVIGLTLPADRSLGLAA